MCTQTSMLWAIQNVSRQSLAVLQKRMSPRLGFGHSNPPMLFSTTFLLPESVCISSSCCVIYFGPSHPLLGCRRVWVTDFREPPIGPLTFSFSAAITGPGACTCPWGHGLPGPLLCWANTIWVTAILPNCPASFCIIIIFHERTVWVHC